MQFATRIKWWGLALALVLSGCGGGGGGAGNGTSPPSNSWDAMVWDQANWS